MGILMFSLPGTHYAGINFSLTGYNHRGEDGKIIWKISRFWSQLFIKCVSIEIEILFSENRLGLWICEQKCQKNFCHTCHCWDPPHKQMHQNKNQSKKNKLIQENHFFFAWGGREIVNISRYWWKNLYVLHPTNLLIWIVYRLANLFVSPSPVSYCFAFGVHSNEMNLVLM